MKLEFPSIEELIFWLTPREEKYEIYIEKELKNIIAMPTVSTRPVKIGVAPYKESIPKTIEEIKKAIPNMEGRIFIINTIDYRIER